MGQLLIKSPLKQLNQNCSYFDLVVNNRILPEFLIESGKLLYLWQPIKYEVLLNYVVKVVDTPTLINITY